jgi:uncharacterized membrane protein YkvA (DUF1232 family)
MAMSKRSIADHPPMMFFTLLANTLMRLYLATPWGLRWLLWLLPIAYFLMPFDLDRLGVFGRIDDILVMVFSFWAFERAGKFKDFYREACQQRRQGATAPPPASDPLEGQTPQQILGVAKRAAAKEIKAAYRRLVALYHPDKFAHLGPEFEATAERRTRAIIAAYQHLQRR